MKRIAKRDVGVRTEKTGALLRRYVGGLSFVTDANTTKVVGEYVHNLRGCSG